MSRCGSTTSGRRLPRRVLFLQLAPTAEPLGVERAGLEGGLDGAAGFVGVGAIAEAAEGGEFGDLGEQHLDAVGGVADIERAHARGVDDPATAGDGVQRARGGGVPALGVLFADAAGFL